MMNERIKEIRTQFYMHALAQQEATKKSMVRLANFERLKPSQYALLDMSEETIVEALAKLQPSPQVLWDLIEKHYRPNFFEPVIFKRYASLFEARDEQAFNQHLT